MKAAWWYRASALVLVLFCAGHTLGFRKTDIWPPQVGPVIAAMQNVHFTMSGATRSYWDFYVGFGLFVSVMMLMSACAAWQLAGVSVEVRKQLGLLRWVMALSQVAIAALTWSYFFTLQTGFAVVVAVMLIVAALLKR